MTMMNEEGTSLYCEDESSPNLQNTFLPECMFSLLDPTPLAPSGMTVVNEVHADETCRAWMDNLFSVDKGLYDSRATTPALSAGNPIPSSAIAFSLRQQQSLSSNIGRLIQRRTVSPQEEDNDSTSKHHSSSATSATHGSDE